ncbi:hypothetical protein [Azospirillum argentinense]|uniref:hypothetical protein n=1 Tax=Azospirillum argentinense TaxID=2970906 RepID=UPI0027E2DAE5|nr:hypothetical protein [Azospirillum argentinense]
MTEKFMGADPPGEAPAARDGMARRFGHDHGTDIEDGCDPEGLEGEEGLGFDLS